MLSLVSDRGDPCRPVPSRRTTHGQAPRTADSVVVLTPPGGRLLFPEPLEVGENDSFSQCFTDGQPGGLRELPLLARPAGLRGEAHVPKKSLHGELGRPVPALGSRRPASAVGCAGCGDLTAGDPGRPAWRPRGPLAPSAPTAWASLPPRSRAG